MVEENFLSLRVRNRAGRTWRHQHDPTYVRTSSTVILVIIRWLIRPMREQCVPGALSSPLSAWERGYADRALP